MALPYATTSNVTKICKELLANSEPQPSPEPTSLDNTPVLDYTYDELKQYDDVLVSQIPEEIVRNIQSYIDLFSNNCDITYIELATKDGHVFKGCIPLFKEDYQSFLNCVNYKLESSSTEWLSLIFTTYLDDETGDYKAVFSGITYNIAR